MTFTFEGYKEAVDYIIKSETSFVEHGIVSWCDAYFEADAKIDGIITFVIFGTDSGNDWKKYQDYKYEALKPLKKW